MANIIKEDVFSITVLDTTKGKTESQVLEDGATYTRVIASWANLNNTGLVRCSIKDGSNEFIAKLQAIENFRSREVEFLKDGKPIEIVGGKKVTITIASESAFTDDTEIDFTFVKDEQ